MQIKIGKIYKVKPEFGYKCFNFFNLEAKYIKFIDNLSYEILNEKNKLIRFCKCFKPEHLEPLEKTLYNLERGDVVEDRYGSKRRVLGLVESNPENQIYVFSCTENFETIGLFLTAKETEEFAFKIVQPEPTEEIKEMTVEEVSKLVGKKVKIVE